MCPSSWRAGQAHTSAGAPTLSLGGFWVQDHQRSGETHSCFKGPINLSWLVWGPQARLLPLVWSSSSPGTLEALLEHSSGQTLGPVFPFHPRCGLRCQVCPLQLLSVGPALAKTKLYFLTESSEKLLTEGEHSLRVIRVLRFAFRLQLLPCTGISRQFTPSSCSDL